MKILVIQKKMIGDVLTSSILFEALRNKFPRAELHYLVYSHTSAVLENNPFIDKIIPFNPKNQKKLKAFWKFSKEIRNEKYDIIIDVYSKINSAFITGLSGAEKRISYYKWYTSKAYTHSFELKKEASTQAGLAVENRMLLLKGISENFPLEIQPKLYLTEEEKYLAGGKLEKSGVGKDKPLFMIGILGSSLKKTYPLPYMAQVLDFIISNTGANLLFNYIPEQEKLAKELFTKCSTETQEHIHFKIYGESLREFMSLTSHCDAFIGNEGGAANMAKALGVPTFSIFSPQIARNVWSLYENEKNRAVHIKDFEKIGKKTSPQDQYRQFTPNLFFNELLDFLKRKP